MSGGNITYAVRPPGIVSPTDHSGKLLIVDVIALTLTLFSVGLRIYDSSRKTRSRNAFACYKDDLLCFLAAAFCIIQCALVWTGVAHGNGKTINQISPDDLVQIQQIQYAVEIFYLAILYCSRASVILLLERLQGLGPKPLWTGSLAALFTAFVTSVFAVALKCDLSHPWIQYNAHCPGLLARWQAVEVLGMIIECAIFGLAFHLVYIGRMPFFLRMKITLLFATRVLVIAFSAVHISYLPSYLHSSDPTFSGVTAGMFLLVEANAGVVTATTPLLKSFILKFTYLHGTTPVATKPLFTVTITEKPSTGSSEDKKPTSTSSSEGDYGIEKEDSNPV